MINEKFYSVINKIENISKKIMGLILIYLSIFLILSINIEISSFFTLINCIFTLCVIYVLHFPLLFSVLENLFSKIIYSAMYTFSIILLISPFFNKSSIILNLIISIVLIILIFKKMNSNEDSNQQLKKYIPIYILWFLYIIQFMFNICQNSPFFKLIDILAIIICLCKYFKVYANIKDKNDKKRSEESKKKSEDYYREHPEEKILVEERIRKENEEREKMEKYLDSVPDYIMPKELYEFDNRIVDLSVSDRDFYNPKKRKNVYVKNFTYIQFKIGLNFYKMRRNEEYTNKHVRYKKYYITTIYEIDRQSIYNAYENTKIDKTAILLDFGVDKYSSLKLPKHIETDDKYFNDYAVKGYLSLYFNARFVLKKVDYDDRKLYAKTIYLDNYAMLVSNNDKTKFYIAELTDKKPEKDEFYVEIMKMLNPNLENYVDIFGNEIMFRKDDK